MMRMFARGFLILALSAVLSCDFVDNAPVRDGDILRYRVVTGRVMLDQYVRFRLISPNTMGMEISSQGARPQDNKNVEYLVDHKLWSAEVGTVGVMGGIVPYWAPKNRRRRGALFDSMRATEETTMDSWRVITFSDGERTARYEKKTGFLVGLDVPRQNISLRLLESNLAGM